MATVGIRTTLDSTGIESKCSKGNENCYQHRRGSSLPRVLVAPVMLLWVLLVSEITPSDYSVLLVSAFRNTPVGTRRSVPQIRIFSGLFLRTDDEISSGDSRSFDNPEAAVESMMFASPNSQSDRNILSMPADEGVVASSSLLKPMAAPRILRVERMLRLPVWPVWAGVVDFFVGWIFGAEAGSKLEQYVLGGRVCPMQFDGKATSPFLLLVHHHHNFWKWDAIFRKISAFVLPEGFPSHPHRGFTTLTYFLEDDHPKSGGGGFVHRDSIGVKQTYGSKGSYKNQAQWLFTGRGMLHEEMFDFVQNDSGKENPGYNPRYELYQLWVNVPGKHKLDPPRVQLLREAEDDGDDDGDDGETMPRVVSDKTTVSPVNGERLTTHSEVVVIAGSYRPHGDGLGDREECFESRAEPVHSDLSVLHVTVEETTTPPTTTAATANREGTSTPGWIYDIPLHHDTLIVYVRKGSCTMETMTVFPINGSISSRSSTPTDVPIHSTVFVEKDPVASGGNGAKERLIVRPKKSDDVLDLLVLSGKPLYRDDLYVNSDSVVEPVAMQGSMVMNSDVQIQQAYMDYQYGQMGAPWEHTLDDQEWMEHVRQTKPRMSTETATSQDYDKRNP